MMRCAPLGAARRCHGFARRCACLPLRACLYVPHRSAQAAATILMAMSLSTVLLSLLFLLIGSNGFTKMVLFTPVPVLSGFLGVIGVKIMLQVPWTCCTCALQPSHRPALSCGFASTALQAVTAATGFHVDLSADHFVLPPSVSTQPNFWPYITLAAIVGVPL